MQNLVVSEVVGAALRAGAAHNRAAAAHHHLAGYAPLLFLVTIGVAVIINMGTNVVFGEISFITQSVSPIMQLAVSLDYAIFLLNSFERHRKEGHRRRGGDAHGHKGVAFPPSPPRAATTVFGFMALIFMRFGIGSRPGPQPRQGRHTQLHIASWFSCPRSGAGLREAAGQDAPQAASSRIGRRGPRARQGAHPGAHPGACWSSYPVSWRRAAPTSSTAWASRTRAPALRRATPSS